MSADHGHAASTPVPPVKLKVDVKQVFARLEPRCQEIAAKYDRRQAALIPVLNLCQETFGCITPEIEEVVARFIGISVTKVHEVRSFYTLYSTTPLGRHRVQVCRTLSCALLGAEDVIERVGKCLAAMPGTTTPDGRVSFEAVECLGACELAPMMRVDDHFEGPLTPEKAEEIVKKLE